MTDQYAVFGNPVEHSKSPDIHRAFAEECGVDLNYSKQLVELDELETNNGNFERQVKQFFEKGGKGLNVTVPFKFRAHDIANDLGELAKQAQAVNTLSLIGKQIRGDNTDGVGLVNDIRKNLDWPIHNKDILIVGAGGAVSGVLPSLIEERPSSITIANRTKQKAESIITQFAFLAESRGVDTSAVALADLAPDSNRLEKVDLIINGTSASLHGANIDIDENIFSGAFCYDMMYGAGPTIFLQHAAKQGAKQIADGLGMLVEQAAAAFTIWTGKIPATKPVIKAVREAMWQC